MALLFMDGFDAGDFAIKWTTTSMASNTTTRFGVGRSIAANGVGNYVRRNYTPSARSICGFAARFEGAVTTNSPVLQWWGDVGATLHLQVYVTAAGALQLYRGVSGSGGTMIATSVGGIILLSTWYYIEASATIDPSAGNVVIKVNGNTVINFTGNTKNGGTNNSTDSIAIGMVANGNLTYLDDFYLSDATGPAPWNDFLGDSRIYTLVPTGPGSNTGLTPSVAPNWDCVNELPYSASDYVSGSVAGVKDTYATSDLPGAVGSVWGVQLNAVAKKTDAGVRAIKTTVRRGSTDYSDAGTALATSDVTYYRALALDPSTSAQWTPANVNAMEIGAEVA